MGINEKQNQYVEFVDGDEVLATLTLSSGKNTSTMGYNDRINERGSRRIAARDFWNLAGDAKSFESVRQKGIRSAGELEERDARVRDDFESRIEKMGGHETVRKLVREVSGNDELMRKGVRNMRDSYKNPEHRARERQRQLRKLDDLMKRRGGSGSDFFNF